MLNRVNKLSFLSSNNLASVIVTAVGAYMMRQPGTVTMRTFDYIGSFNLPIGTTLTSSRAGMAPFGKWHDFFLFFNSLFA